MTDCCQQNYDKSNFDSMNIIKHMSDNNLDTVIAKPGDEKIGEFWEEISYPMDIGENRNPTIYSTNIESEDDKKFVNDIWLHEYGRPKQDSGRLVRISLISPKLTEIKRNLVRMAKRNSLVRMAKQPSPEQMAKSGNLVRMAKQPSPLNLTKRFGLV